MDHIVFLNDSPLDAILAGRKRWKLRVSVRRLAYNVVAIGDRLFLKRTGGEIEAVAIIGQIDRYDTNQRAAFLERYAVDAAARAYLDAKRNARYGAAIRLDDVRTISFPPHLTPRNRREGWVANFDAGVDFEFPLSAR